MTTLILSIFFSISASAYDVEVDGKYYNLISKLKVAEVTKGDKKYEGDITIPSFVKINDTEFSVTSIGNSAFEDCNGLKSVTIPNSVTSIGDYAFKWSGLTSVTIPNSVTSIGGGSFDNCSSLTSVIIPNSVTSIGEAAFELCNGLTSVTIPNSVTSIRRATFCKCRGLKSVTIPNSVTSIGEYAFSDCSGLTSVTIPNSVISIENGAFSGCSGLTSVTIPNSVTSIGAVAFSKCSGLTSVTIPNSVTSIGESAFNDCSGLTSVTIPNSVKSIGEYTFYNCSGLTSVTIPNSVKSIGDYAFGSCPNLENVYCYAENLYYSDDDIFKDSYIEYATLHVPSSAISYYQTTAPWSGFGTIKALESTDVGTKKCETPTISFADGELIFNCATEGVEYVSEINSNDINKFYTEKVSLTACYDISVTATKSGFSNSDVATAKLYWLPSSGSLDETSINNVSMRGIAIQSAGGFVTISGLDNDETVSFYATDGKNLGFSTAINGTTFFTAKSGSVVIAKFGNESIKILVK